MTAKRQCPAKSKRTGQRCKRYLKPGEKVCRWHGGKAPQVEQAAGKRAAVEEIRAMLGVPVEVDPGEALRAAINEANGNVNFLRTLVQQLHPETGSTGSMWSTVKPNERAELHVLIVFYNAERDRLAHLAALALKAGIEERRQRLQEADVERFLGALSKAVEVLPGEMRKSFLARLAGELRALTPAS